LFPTWVSPVFRAALGHLVRLARLVRPAKIQQFLAPKVREVCKARKVRKVRKVLPDLKD